ncbi:8829_t:CDS:10 [Funneliformis mosseae]|uniref:8829_t:CDS:1 n=1 Tax=Funneliformis mosseae TaxID=27381 RepID=A0A9N8VKB7_FUNMO|nr:8829_t:CDS:10 [Funneliformis mosseae]
MELFEPTRQYEIDISSYTLHSPLSPQSPHTPPLSPPSPYQDSHAFNSKQIDKPKANNPLVDLIETEKIYVSDLKCLLQQVTASWSRDNLPPLELDLMFRHIEIIYKQNKKFYSKLSKIGSSPVLARDLGDTLMGWVDDMVGPYTKYAENFRLGFDSWPEIEENSTLQQTLNDISAEKNQPVSLDYFFDMPFKRLHYYKKLYMRLYRSTEPGRSDANLLLSANERIDFLLEMEEEIKGAVMTSSVSEEVVSSVVISEEVSSLIISSVEEDVSSAVILPVEIDNDEKDNISIKSPSTKSQNISSPVDLKNWTMKDLENQLDTSKTKDLFTKLPKIVKLSFFSTNLPFKREIVLHDDFIIEITESMNSIDLSHINVHMFLLTDLLLICQQITQEEKQEFFLEKDMRLLYPPLSTKHLAIKDVSDGEEEMLELTVLQKEMIVIYVDTKEVKDDWLKEVTKSINLSFNGTEKPQLGIDLKAVRKFDNNSQLSTPPMSANAIKRSPSVGNLISKQQLQSPSPLGSGGFNSQSSSLFPSTPGSDSPIVRSLTPDPPRNVGGNYPGDYVPFAEGNEQGTGQGRLSDPISPLDIKNRLNAGLRERSNSIASLASVMSIAVDQETIFRSSSCEVFTWVNGEWKPLTKKDKCIVEIRMTAQKKGCWAIILGSSNRMVLNAWIYSSTTLHREDANSFSISCEMGQRREYYKIDTIDSTESDQFIDSLLKVRESARGSLNVSPEFISRSSSLQTIEPLREVEQTITQIMETRCRVFLQNDHGVWTNLGWGSMKLSLETPSHRKRVIVNSDKKKTKTIIDAIIWEDGVERVGKCKVALTLNNMGNNMRIIYLLQMKDEASAVKVFDIMKEKRKK